MALIAPVINYRWPSLPRSLIKDDFRRRFIKWALWLANHCPKLLHWWVTQKWLPSNAVIEKNPTLFNKNDIDILKTIPGFPMFSKVKSYSYVSAIIVGSKSDNLNFSVYFEFRVCILNLERNISEL